MAGAWNETRPVLKCFGRDSWVRAHLPLPIILFVIQCVSRTTVGAEVMWITSVNRTGSFFFLCDIPQTITMIICGLFTKNLKRVASKQGTPPSVYPQDALESELIRFRSGVARFRRNLRHPPHRALYSAPDQHPPPNRLLSPFLSCSVSGAFY